MLSPLEWLDQHLSEWQEGETADFVERYLAEVALDEFTSHQMIRRQVSEEFRSALRRKNPKGVPLFGNVVEIASDGNQVHRYKKTAVYAPDDYETTIRSDENQAEQLIRRTIALRDDCKERHGVAIQLRFESCLLVGVA